MTKYIGEINKRANGGHCNEGAFWYLENRRSKHPDFDKVKNLEEFVKCYNKLVVLDQEFVKEFNALYFDDLSSANK